MCTPWTPVIEDIAKQVLAKIVLEIEWEPKSYGFKPGRGCHDAIQQKQN